jgi:hypothetical protein
MPYPFPCPLPPETIRQGRAEVLRRVLARFPELRQAPPPRMPAQALPFMLAAYDQVFFAGYLATRGDRLSIAGSTRMTRAAGTCTVRKPPRAPALAEVRMGVDFLLRLGDGPFEANGLRFDTALEAFLSVLEHELCHAVDFLLYQRLDHHGPNFRALSQGLFGHSRCTHALPTRAQEAAAQGMGVGCWVRFPYERRVLRGLVTRVGKTATVMVPAPRGGYRDDAGTRYVKYTVPLALLRPDAEG